MYCSSCTNLKLVFFLASDTDCSDKYVTSGYQLEVLTSVG